MSVDERGLSKSNNTLVKNFAGATSEKNTRGNRKIISEKPGSIIIHAVTSDLTNSINSLNRAIKKLHPNRKKTFALAKNLLI